MLGLTLLVCLLSTLLAVPDAAIAQHSEKHAHIEQEDQYRDEHEKHHHGEMSPELIERNRVFDAAWDKWRSRFYGLKVEDGIVVADIGAGDGELTMLMAEKVGAGGVVYANEIVAAKLHGINQRAADNGLPNVVPVLGSQIDPLLPPDQVDLAIMVEVLHHVSNKAAFLENTHRRIKAGARLVIIEADVNQEGGNPDGCYSDPVATRRLVENAGFEVVGMRTVTIVDCPFMVLTAVAEKAAP